MRERLERMEEDHRVSMRGTQWFLYGARTMAPSVGGDFWGLGAQWAREPYVFNTTGKNVKILWLDVALGTDPQAPFRRFHLATSAYAAELILEASFLLHNRVGLGMAPLGFGISLQDTDWSGARRGTMGLSVGRWRTFYRFQTSSVALEAGAWIPMFWSWLEQVVAVEGSPGQFRWIDGDEEKSPARFRVYGTPVPIVLYAGVGF